MKRAIGLIVITAACIAAFLSVRGTLPFMPIFGSSMEPTLKSGGLLLIEPMEAQDIKEGDIIVYSVPSMVRDYYNYPPTVAHRVVKIYTTPSLTFRTAGDNTGEDPFTIRPQDIRGTVGSQIPMLGLPLLFFQSQQGMIFVIIALALLAFFLYGGEITRGGSIIHRGIFAPVINEEKRTNRVLTSKIESTEQKMNNTEQALEKFAAAVAEYAQHLASHTSAIQGLSEASHELKRGAAEQNRVLMSLVENMGKFGPAPDAKPMKVPAPAKQETEIAETEKPFHGALEKGVPGCARKRPLTREEILSKQDQI
jgi:signal peptidase I